MVIFLIGGQVIALILPLWQFILVLPGLETAYHQPIWPGWGWWVTAAGLIISALGGIALIRPRS